MGRLFALLCTAMLLVGCSPRVAQVTKVLHAGELGATAVLPFDGTNGNVFADRVSYELLNSGASLLDRSRVDGVLQARGLQTSHFGPDTPLAKLMALGTAMKADTIVVGQVTGPPSTNRLMDQLRGFSGYPVTTAAIRFVRVSDGATLSYVSYRTERDIPLLRDDSYKVAHKLVAAAFGR
ncbi:MAG: hypothetical protein P8180_12260 [Gammaproteobacteria bacterium]|jgi:hypothetical protein